MRISKGETSSAAFMVDTDDYADYTSENVKRIIDLSLYLKKTCKSCQRTFISEDSFSLCDACGNQLILEFDVDGVLGFIDDYSVKNSISLNSQGMFDEMFEENIDVFHYIEREVLFHRLNKFADQIYPEILKQSKEFKKLYPEIDKVFKDFEEIIESKIKNSLKKI